MKSLIENILSIETQADELLASSRTQAKEREKAAEVEIRKCQEEVAVRVSVRVEAFRAEAEKKYATDVTASEAAYRKAVQSIEQVSDSVIEKHAQHIVARFREI